MATTLRLSIVEFNSVLKAMTLKVHGIADLWTDSEREAGQRLLSRLNRIASDGAIRNPNKRKKPLPAPGARKR